MRNSILKLEHMKGFKYGGISYDFSYVVDRKTGEPVHELCGFALVSAISEKNRTPSSSKSIVQQLKIFWEDLVIFNQIDWRLLSDEEIEQYLYEYRFLEKKLAANSINLQKSAIQSFYDFAYKYGFIEFPMELDIGFELDGFKEYLEYPDPHIAIESQYIQKNDFEKLLAKVPGESNYLLHRNELALMLGYHCGVRTHELTNEYNFRINQLLNAIDKAKKNKKSSFELTIYGKGNQKPREILITTKVFNKLNQFISDKKLRGKFPTYLPLFLDQNGKPIIGTGLGSYVFRQAKAAHNEFIGKKWQHRTYHSLRHTFATNLATWLAVRGEDWRLHLPPRMGHKRWETSQIYVEVEALMNNRSDVLNKLKPITKLRAKRSGR
jgi:site-specific recombinase XerD